MKDGDYILCIKESISEIWGFGDKPCIVHIKGKIYKINDIKYINGIIDFIWVDCEKDTSPNGYYGYPIVDSEKQLFYDHFSTVKEQRKLKLEKLNENR